MLPAEPVEDFAGLYDAWIDNCIVDIQAGTAGLHEAVVTQQGQMLGNIGFRKAGDCDKFLDGMLAVFQNIEDFEAFRVGEDAINMGIFVIGFARQGRFR